MTTVDLHTKEARKLDRHLNSWVNYALRLVLQAYEKLDDDDDVAVERFYSWANETLCPAFWGAYEMHFLYGERDPEQWLEENRGFLLVLEAKLLSGKDIPIREQFPHLFKLGAVKPVEDVPDEEVACACEDGDCMDCNGQNVKCKDCKYGGCKKDIEKERRMERRLEEDIFPRHIYGRIP